MLQFVQTVTHISKIFTQLSGLKRALGMLYQFSDPERNIKHKNRQAGRVASDVPYLEA